MASSVPAVPCTPAQRKLTGWSQGCARSPPEPRSAHIDARHQHDFTGSGAGVCTRHGGEQPRTVIALAVDQLAREVYDLADAQRREFPSHVLIRGYNVGVCAVADHGLARDRQRIARAPLDRRQPTQAHDLARRYAGGKDDP